MIPTQLTAAMIVLRCFDANAQLPCTDGFPAPDQSAGPEMGLQAVIQLTQFKMM
jgi:hypothetical protein